MELGTKKCERVFQMVANPDLATQNGLAHKNSLRREVRYGVRATFLAISVAAP